MPDMSTDLKKLLGDAGRFAKEERERFMAAQAEIKRKREASPWTREIPGTQWIEGALYIFAAIVMFFVLSAPLWMF